MLSDPLNKEFSMHGGRQGNAKGSFLDQLKNLQVMHSENIYIYQCKYCYQGIKLLSDNQSELWTFKG